MSENQLSPVPFGEVKDYVVILESFLIWDISAA